MKILKYLLYIILVVVIGGAVFFGIKSGKYDVSSSREMNVPQEVVFEMVNNLKSWREWGPWMQLDPEASIEYSESSSGVGASYTWKSDNPDVGEGMLKTIALSENDSIEQEIIFYTPFGDSKSTVYWEFAPGADSSNVSVTWGMKGVHSLLEKVFLAFQSESFDDSIKAMFDQGLENLEENAVESMKEFSIVVDGIKQHGGGYYLYTTAVSKISDLGDKMGPMFGKVSNFMAENNLAHAGMPFTIYNQIDLENATVIFSTCIPVSEKVITPSGSDVLCGYLNPSRSLKTTLRGNYSNLGEAYDKAQLFVLENNLVPDPKGNMFEVYKTDPGNLPNPADWITEIYLPLSNETKLTEK